MRYDSIADVLGIQICRKCGLGPFIHMVGLPNPASHPPIVHWNRARVTASGTYTFIALCWRAMHPKPKLFAPNDMYEQAVFAAELATALHFRIPYSYTRYERLFLRKYLQDAGITSGPMYDWANKEKP